MKQSKHDAVNIFQQRFNELIIESGMNNTEFSKFVGISRQTVGFYANGDRTPKLEHLAIIAEKCCVSVDYLLGLTEVKKTDPDLDMIQKYTGLSPEAISQLNKSVQRERKAEIKELSMLIENPSFPVLMNQIKSYKEMVSSADDDLQQYRNEQEIDYLAAMKCKSLSIMLRTAQFMVSDSLTDLIDLYRRGSQLAAEANSIAVNTQVDFEKIFDDDSPESEPENFNER